MSNNKRAKSKNAGEWVYGSIARTESDVYIIESAKTVDGKLVINDATLVDIGTVCDFITLVDTDTTVFTELYQYDVVKTTIMDMNLDANRVEEIDVIGVVLWSDDFLQWEVVSTKGDIHRLSQFIEEFGIDCILGSQFDIDITTL